MILRHSHVIVQESETDQLSLILGMYRNIMINNSSTIRSRAKQHRTQYMFDPIGTLYSQHFHFFMVFACYGHFRKKTQHSA